MSVLVKLRQCADARLREFVTADLFVVAALDRGALIAEIEPLAAFTAGEKLEDRIYGKPVVFRRWVDAGEPQALTWREFDAREMAQMEQG